MILLIIAIIILIVYVSFFSSRKKQLRQFGELTVHYSVLIDYFKSLPNTTIVIKSKSKIEIVTKPISNICKNYFTILYLIDGKISVIWNGVLYTGQRRTKNWRFPAYMDQQQMIDEIETDLYLYLY